MASTKDYLDFVLDQLSDLEDIRFRQMMGEYIIYYKDKNGEHSSSASYRYEKNPFFIKINLVAV